MLRKRNTRARPTMSQRNVGPSSVTIVIVRKDLIGNAQRIFPVMLDYKIHAENDSLYNTPPCYGIYMCGLVFEDLLEQGVLKEIEKKNEKGCSNSCTMN